MDAVFASARYTTFASASCLVQVCCGRFGFVDVCIRRPTGSISFLMHLQNSLISRSVSGAVHSPLVWPSGAMCARQHAPNLELADADGVTVFPDATSELRSSQEPPTLTPQCCQPVSGATQAEKWGPPTALGATQAQATPSKTTSQSQTTGSGVQDLFERLRVYEASTADGFGDDSDDDRDDEISVEPEFVVSLLQDVSERPHQPLIRLEEGEALQRALNVLDRTSPYETMKIGVIYVAPNQTSEADILNNCAGSPRYEKFLRRLGKLVCLKGSMQYSGGLDRCSDEDGRFALMYSDELSRVCFHVATLMPNSDMHQHAEHKKRHIGNDHVNVVFYEGAQAYDPATIKGQFNFVNVVVYPLGEHWYRIRVHRRAGVPKFGFLHECDVVSEASLAPVVRQTAIFAQIACQSMFANHSDCFEAWQERQRQIQCMIDRLAKLEVQNVSP